MAYISMLNCIFTECLNCIVIVHTCESKIIKLLSIYLTRSRISTEMLEWTTDLSNILISLKKKIKFHSIIKLTYKVYKVS